MFGSGDTAGGQIVSKNKVRIDFDGDIVKCDFGELKGLHIGDRVTLYFCGNGIVDKIEKEEFGGVF